MILRMTLDTPVVGFWDGGERTSFDYTLDGLPRRDRQGAYIRVGSWQANAWFHVALGTSARATLGNARRCLVARAKRAGLRCAFAYIITAPNAFERRAFGPKQEGASLDCH